MDRYPTYGHGRNTAWIAVHRLRCTVRRFVDQRSYSATPSAVRAGVDKTTSRCQGDGTYYPNGRLLCERRKNVCPSRQTNKIWFLDVFEKHIQPSYDRQRVKIKSIVLRFDTVPDTVMDFRPGQPDANSGGRNRRNPVPSIH